MGTTALQLKLPTDYTEAHLEQRIGKKFRNGPFTYRIQSKSLDARKKNNIHWQIKVLVTSPTIHTTLPPLSPPLSIPRLATTKKAIVVGSGPAGFFAAYVLQRAGIATTLLERGADVDTRAAGIKTFEETGTFDPQSNYAFGEGGAGTFSDGKLTSRTKRITQEKAFIIQSYISAGAPAEIAYMAHPHLGSDNLKNITRNLREKFQKLGGTIHFNTMLNDISIANDTVTTAITNQHEIATDYVIIAPGHSAYETSKMLMKRGVQFRNKNFALGCRIEHPQSLINRAQWKTDHLPGVKAAEYRLTFSNKRDLPVYTFCMCPGGVVVPATAYAESNVVNGMSMYQRDGAFANAACVAGVTIENLAQRETTPLETLAWLQDFEEQFYTYSQSYKAPFCTIQDFMTKRETTTTAPTSYPLGLTPAPLWKMLPRPVTLALRSGLRDFCGKLRGFEKGIMLGLESKTSAPIQVIREDTGRCTGFTNLYLAGEGSGYSGGIISSAADGIKAAMSIIAQQ